METGAGILIGIGVLIVIILIVLSVNKDAAPKEKQPEKPKKPTDPIEDKPVPTPPVDPEPEPDPVKPEPPVEEKPTPAKPPKTVYEIQVNTNTDEDQTAEILKQWNSIPDGGSHMFAKEIVFPPGRIHAEGDLANNPRGINGRLGVFRRKHWNLRGAEDGSTDIWAEKPAVEWGTPHSSNTSSQAAHLRLWLNEHIQVHNLNISGGNILDAVDLGHHPNTPEWYKGLGNEDAAGEGFGLYYPAFCFEHGIDARGNKGLIIKNVHVKNVFGDSFYIGHHRIYDYNVAGGSWVNTWALDTELQHVISEHNGRQGLGIGGNVRNMKVSKFNFKNSRRGSIDFEQDLKEDIIDNIEIWDGEMNSHLKSFPAGGPGEVNNIFVHEVKFNSGIYSYPNFKNNVIRKNWRFHNNEGTGAYVGSGPAHSIILMDNFEFIGNTMAMAPGGKFMELEFCRNPKIEDNKITGDVETIIEATAVSGLSASNNGSITIKELQVDPAHPRMIQYGKMQEKYPI